MDSNIVRIYCFIVGEWMHDFPPSSRKKYGNRKIPATDIVMVNMTKYAGLSHLIVPSHSQTVKVSLFAT